MNIDLKGTFHIQENGNDYTLIPESATNNKEGIVKLATAPDENEGAIAATPDSVKTQIQTEVFTVRSDDAKIPWENINIDGGPVIRGTDPSEAGELLALDEQELLVKSKANVGSNERPIHLENGNFVESYSVSNVQQTLTTATAYVNQPLLLRPANATMANEPAEYDSNLLYFPPTQQLQTPNLIVSNQALLNETEFYKAGEPFSPSYYPLVNEQGNPREGRSLTTSIEDYVIEEFIPAYNYVGNETYPWHEGLGTYTLLGDYRHVPANSDKQANRVGPFQHWAYRIWRNGRLEIWRYCWLSTESSPSGQTWGPVAGWTKYGDAYWETLDHSYRNIYNRNDMSSTGEYHDVAYTNIQLPSGISFQKEPTWQVNLRYVHNSTGHKPVYIDYNTGLSQIAGFKWNIPSLGDDSNYLLPPYLRAYTFGSSNNRDQLSAALHMIYYEVYATGFYDISRFNNNQ